MTPREKAKNLLHEYRMLLMDEGEDYGQEILVSVLSKQCALITVDEILSMGIMSESGDWNIAKPYWQEVKQEIEKL